MRPAVFLDRDGVIILDRKDYVKSWEEVEFIPASFEAVRKLNARGLPVIIVTNQSAVGRGIVTMQFVETVHSGIVSEFASRGGKIDAVYCCPHRPDEGCDCRKPLPGMLLRASRDLDIDLTNSIMIGDSLRDIEAAGAAGSQGVLVRTGKGAGEEAKLSATFRGVKPVAIADDIRDAVEYILSTNRH